MSLQSTNLVGSFWGIFGPILINKPTWVILGIFFPGLEVTNNYMIWQSTNLAGSIWVIFGFLGQF